MRNGVGIMVVIAIMALPVVIWLIVYLIKRSKGSLKFSVPNLSFESEENIKGDLIVLLKKDVPVDYINISLVGLEETVRYSNDRNGRSSRRRHWDIIYTDEQNVNENILVGIEKSIPFEFKNPFASKAENEEDVYGKNSAFIGTVTKGLEIFSSSRRGRVKWELRSRLKTKGLDITGRRRITIKR